MVNRNIKSKLKIYHSITFHRGLASLGQKQQKEETCSADEEKQETIESPRKDRTLDCYKEIKSRLKIKEPLAVSAECGEELPKVIILGAGLAGLSAAYHLLKHGHNNVVILEASERLLPINITI